MGITKINFDNLLIHASAFSKLTTEPKTKADKDAGNISVTTKTHLKEIYLEEKYGRKKEINTKQMEKGILQEEEAITLYCRFKKIMYKRYEGEPLTNDYLIGTPDLLDTDDNAKILSLLVKKGIDIKCSWSIFSFPFPDDKLDNVYEWQNQVYMVLTGADEWATAYCLVNAPDHLINDEKRKVFYKLNSPEQSDDPETPNPVYTEYINKCIEIEKNMIFDMSEFKKANPYYDIDCPEWTFDIPLEERVREFTSRRDKFMIEDMPLFVTKARKYLNGIENGEF